MELRTKAWLIMLRLDLRTSAMARGIDIATEDIIGYSVSIFFVRDHLASEKLNAKGKANQR